MIINSGMKFSIVTSRRKISENEDFNFKCVLQNFAPNLQNFSMQEIKKYDKVWQGNNKYDRAKNMSERFVFF